MVNSNPFAKTTALFTGVKLALSALVAPASAQSLVPPPVASQTGVVPAPGSGATWKITEVNGSVVKLEQVLSTTNTVTYVNGQPLPDLSKYAPGSIIVSHNGTPQVYSPATPGAGTQPQIVYYSPTTAVRPPFYAVRSWGGATYFVRPEVRRHGYHGPWRSNWNRHRFP